MTESVLQSQSSFIRYLAEKYDVNLTEPTSSEIKLLIEQDKDALGRALYRFEDFIMKRRANKLHGEKNKQAKVGLCKDVSKAAQARKVIETSKEETNKESDEDGSCELFSSSLEDAFLLYTTPKSSQVESTFSSSQQATTLSRTTSITLTSSQDSTFTGPKEAIKVNYIGEDSRHLDFLSRDVPYLVKYFYVALVSHGLLSWCDFNLDCIRKLRGLSSVEAMQCLLEPEVKRLLPCASQFITESLLEACEDLDKEEDLLKKGFMNLHDEKQGWIGGKINFTGTISIDKGGKVNIRLQLPIKKTSCRFTRRFGSGRFLRLKMQRSYQQSHDTDRDRLKEFWSRPLCILNHQFSFLEVKDNTIVLFELRNDISSISNFYDWHGPWEDNMEGKIVKYLKRLPLGFSTSIPGPLIPATKVRKMKDIVSPEGIVMTDGAAPISRAAMIKIAAALELQSIPSAVQGRYGGAKGVWYLDPNEDSEEVDELWIGIRDSQTKLHRNHTTEECHQVIDILRTSKAMAASSLSKQIMFVLSENGVPNETLIKMQEDQLKRVMVQFFGEMGEGLDRLELAKVLDEEGGVSIGRIRRDSPHLAAAKGLLSRAAEDIAEREVEDEDEEGATLDSISPPSNERRTHYTRAYDMIMAGFEVKESKTLAYHVVKAVEMSLNRIMIKFKIDIERSIEVIVIPDPVGVLEEGEVQLRFGHNGPIDPITKERLTSLKGDVLVTRHPCLTAIDIRKVKATTYTELAMLTDVIIFSTRGDRSLADMLSGGDYDGDTIRVFWENSLVEPFTNAIVEEHQPSITLKDVFEQDSESVKDFFNAGFSSCEDREKRLSNKLLKPLFMTDRKGKYGNFHLNAAYMKGIASQEAIDMAFKFNNCMDGAKTGLIIKSSIVLADSKRFDRRLPDWGRKIGDEKLGQNPPSLAKRQVGLPECIFDAMYKRGKVLLDKLKADLDMKLHKKAELDPDLSLHWQDAISKGRLTALQIEVFQTHCKSILSMNHDARVEYARARPTSESPRKGSKMATPFSSSKFNQIPVQYQAWVLDKEKAFEMANIPIPEGNECRLQDIIDQGEMQRLQKLLASCLYVQACNDRNKREEVALDTAWDHLLTIKAEQVAKRKGQRLITMPTSTANALRLRRVKATTE